MIGVPKTNYKLFESFILFPKKVKIIALNPKSIYVALAQYLRPDGRIIGNRKPVGNFCVDNNDLMWETLVYDEP